MRKIENELKGSWIIKILWSTGNLSFWLALSYFYIFIGQRNKLIFLIKPIVLDFLLLVSRPNLKHYHQRCNKTGLSKLLWDSISFHIPLFRELPNATSQYCYLKVGSLGSQQLQWPTKYIIRLQTSKLAEGIVRSSVVLEIIDCEALICTGTDVWLSCVMNGLTFFFSYSICLFSWKNIHCYMPSQLIL